MSRTIARKARMDKTVVLRCHEEDAANIKLAAMNEGIDCSAFLRRLLVKSGVINSL